MIIILVLLALLAFVYFSKSNDFDREIINCSVLAEAIGPYSHAVKVGNRVYVSGQIGINKNGLLDSSSIKAETEQCLKNIKAIVESAGYNLKNISKCSVFITNMNDFKKMNEVYSLYFPENAPARETIEVSALPKGAHIEISAIVN